MGEPGIALKKRVTGESTGSIYERLQDRRAAGYPAGTTLPKDSEDMGVSSVWKNMEHTRHRSPARGSTDKTPPVAVTSAASGAVYEMAQPKGKMGELEKAELHHKMYTAQINNGKFVAGPKAKYDADSMARQVKCPH